MDTKLWVNEVCNLVGSMPGNATDAERAWTRAIYFGTHSMCDVIDKGVVVVANIRDRAEGVLRQKATRLLAAIPDVVPAAPVNEPAVATPKMLSAVKTLERLGYTYRGGELWAPPITKRFLELTKERDELRAKLDAIKGVLK